MSEFLNFHSNCVHPIRVNQGGRVIYVPCRKCPACILRLANSRADLVSLEAREHKFCYFVTLTYATDKIPYYRFHRIDEDDPHNFIFIDSCERSEGFMDEVTIRFTSGQEYDLLMSDIDHCADMKDKISYCLSSDLQKFFKLLRYYIYEQFKETEDIPEFRYYAVQDYGTKYKRAHFHALLFFDDQRLVNNISYFVYKSWRLGITDCQLSRGGAGAYVTGYLNSLVALPQCYKSRPLRCRSYHSRNFGVKTLLPDPSRYYEDQFDFSNLTVDYYADGRIYTKPLPGNFINYIYPKCFRYGVTTATERLRIYRLYNEVLQEYAFTHSGEVPTISHLALWLFNLCCAANDRNLFYFRPDGSCGLAESIKDINSDTLSFVMYLLYTDSVDFVRSQRLIRNQNGKLTDVDGIFPKDANQYQEYRRLLRILQQSVHFLNYCCQGDYSKLRSMQVFKAIDDYWSYRSLKSLAYFYITQDKALSEVSDDLVRFYRLLSFYCDDGNFTATALLAQWQESGRLLHLPDSELYRIKTFHERLNNPVEFQVNALFLRKCFDRLKHRTLKETERFFIYNNIPESYFENLSRYVV